MDFFFGGGGSWISIHWTEIQLVHIIWCPLSHAHGRPLCSLIICRLTESIIHTDIIHGRVLPLITTLKMHVAYILELRIRCHWSSASFPHWKLHFIHCGQQQAGQHTSDARRTPWHHSVENHPVMNSAVTECWNTTTTITKQNPLGATVNETRELEKCGGQSAHSPQAQMWPLPPGLRLRVPQLCAAID